MARRHRRRAHVRGRLGVVAIETGVLAHVDGLEVGDRVWDHGRELVVGPRPQLALAGIDLVEGDRRLRRLLEGGALCETDFGVRNRSRSRRCRWSRCVGVGGRATRCAAQHEADGQQKGNHFLHRHPPRSGLRNPDRAFLEIDFFGNRTGRVESQLIDWDALVEPRHVDRASGHPVAAADLDHRLDLAAA